MVNTKMMYLRPGNLLKEFVIECNNQIVMSTGRVANDYSSVGTKTLKDALQKPLMRRGQTIARKTTLLPIPSCRREGHGPSAQISWCLGNVSFTLSTSVMLHPLECQQCIMPKKGGI